jgi:hypothetical protein
MLKMLRHSNYPVADEVKGQNFGLLYILSLISSMNLAQELFEHRSSQAIPLIE